MFFNGRKKVSFKTGKQSSGDERKKFILIFAACVVLVLSLSLVLILGKNGFDFRSAIGGDLQEETTVTEETTKVNTEKSDNIFMIWSAAKDRSTMSLIWLVRAEMPQRRFTVCSVDPEAAVTMGGKGVTFEEIYSKSGEKELVAAMEAYSGFKIDRYFGAADDNFKAFVNYLGGVDIDVPEQVNYRGKDFNVILVKGRQNMKGDTLFKYLLCLGSAQSGSRKAQCEVFGEFLGEIFSEKRIEKRNGIFAKISNTMKTNATIVDFSRYDGNIQSLMQNGISEMNIVSMPFELEK